MIGRGGLKKNIEFWGCLTFISAVSLLFSILSIQKAPPHGDESHYLLITISLLRDGDLDLTNNYALRHYHEFMPYTLTPHRITFGSSRIYSSHEPGVPFLLLIPYSLSGRTGTIYFMNILAFLTLWQLGAWMRSQRMPDSAVFGALCAVGLTLPWVMMSGMVFPEIAGALVMLTSLRMVSVRGRAAWSLFGCLLLCCLPWMHIKFTVLSVMGYLYFLFSAKPSVKLVLMTAVLCITAAFLLFYFQYMLFGDPFYLLTFRSSGFHLPLKGLLGLFLDREAGLITYGPIYLIFFLAVPLMVRRDTHRAMLLATILVLSIVSGGWVDWHGGHGPPARYLVPLLPLMGISIGMFLNEIQNRLKWWLYGFLMLCSCLQTILVVIQNPETVIVVGDGRNRLWNHFPEMVSFIMPSLLNPYPGTGWTIVGWLMMVTLLLGYFYWKARSGAIKTVTSFLGLGLAVFFIFTGVRIESSSWQQAREMPLSVEAPTLLAPDNGSVWSETMPDLTWNPVPGADGYIWNIHFPNGYKINVPVYGKTTVELPDSVLSAIPEGEYRWFIIPIKDRRQGTPSETWTFSINRL